MAIDRTGERTLSEQAYEPAWSPDGSRLAVVSDREGTRKIYTVDAGGGDLVRLSDGPNDDQPAWAPDGRGIAFQSERAGKPLILGDAARRDPEVAAQLSGNDGRDIYFMQSDGSGIVRLTDDPSYSSDPAWSPDSNQLAFVSNRDGDFDLYAMKADGTDVRRLTNIPGGNRSPSWTP